MAIVVGKSVFDLKEWKERKEAADLASLFSGFYSIKMVVTYLRSNGSKAPIPIYFATMITILTAHDFVG